MATSTRDRRSGAVAVIEWSLAQHRGRGGAAQAGALDRELAVHCREHSADVEGARSVDFRDDLPRHSTGKLYRRVLEDEYRKVRDTRLS